MMKSALTFLVSLLVWTTAAFAQTLPTSANPASQNKTKNVWAGDNFEQVCTITATGSPGTFTPICPSNNITVTASGQTIALPAVGTPQGFKPSEVTKSVELNIFYAAGFTPTFASGYNWVNGTPPVQCAGGASACLAGVISANPDLIECRTVSEAMVRCGPPLTAMGPAPSIHFVQGPLGSYTAGSSTTVSATGAAIGSGNMVVGAAYGTHTNTITLNSCTDDKSNTYTILDQISDTPPGHWLTTFILYNITNGPSAITCTFSAGATSTQMMWLEYSGAGAGAVGGHTGQAQVNPGTGTDAITSGSASGSLLAVGFGLNFQSSSTQAVGTGFTQRLHDTTGSALGFIAEDKILSPASVAATFTDSAGASGNYLTALVTLHP